MRGEFGGFRAILSQDHRSWNSPIRSIWKMMREQSLIGGQPAHLRAGKCRKRIHLHDCAAGFAVGFGDIGGNVVNAGDIQAEQHRGVACDVDIVRMSAAVKSLSE